MTTPIKVGNGESGNFSPYMTPNGPEGEVSWIRDSGADGVDVRVGVWRCADGEFPEPFPVKFAGAETLYVLEGTLRLEVLETGEVITVRPGDIVSVERDTETTWTVPSAFKAVMFIAGGQ